MTGPSWREYKTINYQRDPNESSETEAGSVNILSLHVVFALLLLKCHSVVER